MAEPVPNSNTLRRSTRTTTRFDYTGLFAKKNKNKLTLCRLTNKRKAHETSTESQPLPKRRRKGHTAYTPKAKNSNLSPQQIKRKQDRIRKQQDEFEQYQILLSAVNEQLSTLQKFKLMTKAQYNHCRKYDMIKLFYVYIITHRCGKVEAYEFVHDFYSVSTKTLIKYLDDFSAAK